MDNEPLTDYMFPLASATHSSAMRYSTQVKSISYLKANAAEMLQTLSEQREPVLITQNGEAKALLKCLAMGDREVDEGQIQPIDEAVAELRAEVRDEFKHRS